MCNISALTKFCEVRSNEENSYCGKCVTKSNTGGRIDPGRNNINEPVDTNTSINTQLCKPEPSKAPFLDLTRCRVKFYHAGAKEAIGNVSAEVLCGQLARRKGRRGVALGFLWELSLPVEVKAKP